MLDYTFSPNDVRIIRRALDAYRRRSTGEDLPAIEKVLATLTDATPLPDE